MSSAKRYKRDIQRHVYAGMRVLDRINVETFRMPWRDFALEMSKGGQYRLWAVASNWLNSYVRENVSADSRVLFALNKKMSAVSRRFIRRQVFDLFDMATEKLWLGETYEETGEKFHLLVVEAMFKLANFKTCLRRVVRNKQARLRYGTGHAKSAQTYGIESWPTGRQTVVKLATKTQVKRVEYSGGRIIGLGQTPLPVQCKIYPWTWGDLANYLRFVRQRHVRTLLGQVRFPRVLQDLVCTYNLEPRPKTEYHTFARLHARLLSVYTFRVMKASQQAMYTCRSYAREDAEFSTENETDYF